MPSRSCRSHAGPFPAARAVGAKVWGCCGWHRAGGLDGDTPQNGAGPGAALSPSRVPAGWVGRVLALAASRGGPGSGGGDPPRAGSAHRWQGAVGNGPPASVQRWEELPAPATEHPLVLASSSAYKRFSELLPKEERGSAGSARVPKSQILTLPELRANPFQHQICHVFSTSGNGDGSMSFEDFLDMLSVFSDSATVNIKSYYAFRIFDFDADGILDRKDLEKVVNCLTGQGEESRLSTAEMEQLIQNILDESDIDRDGTINLSEFQHTVSRSPDFASSFKIVL